MIKREVNFRIFFLILIILSTLAITSCSNKEEPIVEINKDCKKTTYQDYSKYLEIPSNKTLFSDVNIALILDTSGSMEGDKLDRAKEASISLIDMFDPNINIALFEFNTNATTRVEFTNDKKIIEKSIKDIKSGGSTFFTNVLNLAKVSFFKQKSSVKSEDKIRSNKNVISDMIIFLSDGQPKDNYQDILNTVKEITSENICIYTIQYTSEDTTDENEMFELQKVLKEMSEISIDNIECGQLYSDVNSQNLFEVFKNIYSQIETINYDMAIKVDYEEIILQNRTNKFSISVHSAYNYNIVPNKDKCIDEFDIDVKLYSKKTNRLIKEFSDDEITLDINKYILDIKNVSVGKYYAIVTSTFKENNNEINGYKRFDFEIVDDLEYFMCDKYSCEDYEKSIGKAIELEKNITLKNPECGLDDLLFNKTIKLNILNKDVFSRYVYLDKIETKTQKTQIISDIIEPNNSTWIHLEPGNYELYCNGFGENVEIKNDNPMIIAIDVSSSISPEKRIYIDHFIKRTSKGKKDISIITFNDESNILIRNVDENIIKTQIEKIEYSGNSKIIPTLERIDQMLTENLLKEHKTIPKSVMNTTQNNMNSTNDTVQITETNEKYNIILISDGIFYDNIKNNIIPDLSKISNIVKNISIKGGCINTISLDNNTILKKITDESNAIINCSSNINIDYKYLAKKTPTKIKIEDYFKNSMDIDYKIISSEKENPFATDTKVYAEVSIYGKDMKNKDNLFGIKCEVNLNSELELYRGTELILAQKGTKVTDNTFSYDLGELGRYNYRIILKAYLSDSNAKTCPIHTQKNIDLDLSQKILVS